MAPLPADRVQSADDWIEKIDTVRRRKAALEQARRDEAIEASIHALVEQTRSGAEDAPVGHPPCGLQGYGRASRSSRFGDPDG